MRYCSELWCASDVSTHGTHYWDLANWTKIDAWLFHNDANARRPFWDRIQLQHVSSDLQNSIKDKCLYILKRYTTRLNVPYGFPTSY